MPLTRFALTLTGVLLAGCATELSAPPEDLRIGPADVRGGVTKDRPHGPWGAHIVAADKLGGFNPYIYRDGRADPDGDGYQCVYGLEGSAEAAYRPGEALFEDCQIAFVIERLQQAFESFPGRRDGATPSELFAPGCAGRPFTLTLFIHGGLNDTVSSMRRARNHTARVLGDCIYPIYLNWEAGPFTSYWDHVVNIRGGERIDTVAPRGDALPRELTRNLPPAPPGASADPYQSIKLFQRIFAPLYIATDLGEAIVRAPTSWIAQGVQGGAETLTPIFPAIQNPGVTLEPCESLYDHPSDDDGSCRAGTGTSWQHLGPDNNVVIEGAAELDLGLKDWWPVALSPLRLVTTPFADSLGESVWNNLLRTVHATLITEVDYEVEQQWFLEGLPNLQPMSRLDPVCARQDEGRADRHRPIGVFSKFTYQLQRFLCAEDGRGAPNHETIKVNLVAHSMGAIIANELVERYDLGYDNIVYVAAASSIRHLALTVVPYIQRRLGQPSARRVEAPSGHLVRFYNLMLHPRREAREARLYGAAPAGSLLVWVDSMYEHTDSTLDRTLGQWANVRRAKWLLPEDAQTQMFFKILGQEDQDAGNGDQFVPRSHGDFNDLFCRHGSVSYAYWDERSWGRPELFVDDEPPPPLSSACDQRSS